MAIKRLAQYAADITETFNERVSSIYSGVSGRVVGPMLLAEASAAIGSPGIQPAAMLTPVCPEAGSFLDADARQRGVSLRGYRLRPASFALGEGG